MISSEDRSFKFGASDTHYFFMNTQTKTFQKWWEVKMGISDRVVNSNIYMETGTMLELPILDAVADILNVVITNSKQITYAKNNMLVVNFDGTTLLCNYEVKCINYKKWLDAKIDKKYWQQVQVQMLVGKYKKTKLVEYGVMDFEYDFAYCINPTIENDRIRLTTIKYDEKWIKEVYLPRLNYLCECLEKGVYPEKFNK